MTHSLQKRLRYFNRLQEKVEQGRFKFDVNKSGFGFKNLEVLVEPSPRSVKSYPCVVYNTKNNIEFAVKIIPLQRMFRCPDKTHPGDIEVMLLQEFNQLVRYGMSPHLTYYITHRPVPNNAKALRNFPLKGLRKYIEPKSLVLVAEYVDGGSIEGWMANETGTLEQWRYILFSVCWTLMILQDRYRCIHNDLHSGNILLDTKFQNGQKPLAYHLVGEDGLDMQFKVIVPGIMPKMWDWEVATTFSETFKHSNPVASGRTHFPAEFDPHYDLHYFCTTLLEQDIPEELVDLIHSLYGDNFIPSEESKEVTFKLYGAGSTASSVTSDSSYASTFDSEIWEIDTSCSTSSAAESDDDQAYYCSSDELDDDGRDKGSSVDDGNEVVLDVQGEVKTEYLLGERMLNGAWRKVKDLPTPLSLLQHDFFACYRDESLKNRAPATTFRHIREKGTAWRLDGDRYV